LAGLMMRLARLLAWFGGLVLLTLVAITCFSVIGRAINTVGHSAVVVANLPSVSALLVHFGPITGDFELVETGIAIAIFAFLPWCTMTGGHATVDLFTLGFRPKFNRILDFVWELVFFLVLCIIAWRIFVGASDKMRYGETTFLLQFPVWWGFAVCGVLAVAGALVSGFLAVRKFSEIGGRNATPAGRGSAIP
jgi:TRAP-type C4-dicarboxylate transport system permease small subunit